MNALARLLACMIVLAALPARAAEAVTVFAASSLASALDALAPLMLAKGVELRASYASSTLLARQIEQGAPADVFIAADRESMDRAVAAGRARDVGPLLANDLVLVAPSYSAIGALPLTRDALAAVLGATGRLATGDPETVPAGRYAVQAMKALMLDALLPRVAGAGNARAALTFVARGEAPLGIVYATDAQAEPRVRVVARFPATSHAPIVYPLAAITTRPVTVRALEILRSPEAAEVFRRQGFRTAF